MKRLSWPRFDLNSFYYLFLFVCMPLVAIWQHFALPALFCTAFLVGFLVEYLRNPERMSGFFSPSRTSLLFAIGAIALALINVAMSVQLEASLLEFIKKLPVVICIVGFIWSSRWLEGDRLVRSVTAGSTISLIAVLYLLETPQRYSILDPENASLDAIYNRSMVVNSVWVSTIIMWAYSSGLTLSRTLGCTILFSLCVFVVLQSESQSALLYLIVFAVSQAFFAFFQSATKLVKYAVLAVLLGIPLIHLVPGLDALTSLDNAIINRFLIYSSAETRLQFWQGFMEVTMQRPWLGWGIGTESELFGLGHLNTSQNFENSPHHPHSMPVQLWVNAGLVGVSFAAVLFWHLLRKIENRSPQIASSGMAIFVALFAVWCVSHGAWQSWWLVTLAVPFGTLAALQTSFRQAN